LVARLVARLYGEAAVDSYRRFWPPTVYEKKVDAVYDAYDADRAQDKDLMDASGLLLAPFQFDGLPPACRLVDRTRWPETVYTRRLAYYLDARLEARPDPELAKVLADLRPEGK
ncbi:MAG: hypothetical protein KGL74_05830, partial [Elusimicrobia bacterium]|nr:hypothetical protein [Elusimicrobiota bacterium]